MNMKRKATLDLFAQRLFNNPVTFRLAKILYFGAQFLSRKLRLRSRHVLTRHNNLRLRYVAGVSTFMITAILSFTLTSGVSGFSAHKFASIAPAVGHNIDAANFINGGLHSDFENASIISHKVLEELPLDREVIIQSGDVLSLVMENHGIGNSDASVIIKAMKPHYDPSRIKVGQKIDLHFDEQGDQQTFREMKMKLNPIKTLVVARAGDDFRATLYEKDVKKVVKAKSAQVKVSLAGSAAQAGIPKSVVAKAINIFSSKIDFQRDIRPNDTLEVMYESYETDSGYVSKTGNILYTKLKLGSKRELSLYRFKTADGRVDYFQPNGRSIKHTLMKTPIKGARMSSGFGKRRHPVLGYTKMHKGVDFAASTGTPIFASGDGVVEKAGWFSSYGKYIRIRHNSKLKTAYAHMSKINSKVKSGKRVKQGQIIGYVGTTGRSTGPHLHYEVIHNGRQVNPRSVNLPIGEELEGKQLANFKATVNRLRRQYASTLDNTKVASRETKKKGFFN